MLNVDSGQIDILTSYNQALALFWCVLWLKSRFDYKVIKVSDGDTVRLKRFWHRKPLTFRLAGIDSPEKKQQGGEAARAALGRMCPVGSRVKVATKEKGAWGRDISWIFCGPVNLNDKMVRLGHAWHYAQYSGCQDPADAQSDARKAKRGLWAGKNPQPPWEWRKKGKG